MNPWAIQSLVAAVFNLTLGIYIVLKGPKRAINNVFSLFAFSLAVWGISEFGHRIAHNPDSAYTWIRGGGIGWCFMASLYLHFVLIFTKRDHILNKKFTYALLYLPPLVFLYLFLTTDLIYEQKVVWRSWGYTSLPGNITWTFYFYYFLIYLLTIYFIARVQEQGSILEKKQARPILIGTTVFLVTATATNIAFPLFSVRLPELGSSLSLILTICTLYAILKYKLFSVELEHEEAKEIDQKYILERGLSYSIKEERLDKSYEIFKDQLLHGSYGLCFSKFHPKTVRERYGLTRTPIIWVTFREDEKTISPKDLDAIESVIFDFLGKAESPVILIDCYTEIRLTNGIDETLDWFQRLVETCRQKDCILLISINPEILDKNELANIATIGAMSL